MPLDNETSNQQNRYRHHADIWTYKQTSFDSSEEETMPGTENIPNSQAGSIQNNIGDPSQMQHQQDTIRDLDDLMGSNTGQFDSVSRNA